MLRQLRNILTFLALVTALLLNGTSHELLHSFTGHRDTQGCNHKRSAPGTTFWEEGHHHCDFLDLQPPVFFLSSLSFPVHAPLLHEDHFSWIEPQLISLVPLHTALRGPPGLTI